MPFIKIEAESIEEYADGIHEDLVEDLKASAGKFNYETASARFKPAKLSEASQLLLVTLKAMKATHFRVTYDGGHDEGFSYPESVTIGDRRFDISEMVELLAARPFLKEARALPSLQGGYSATTRDDEFIRYIFDELAQELASRLLGEGFGTGEYELYGSFTTNLLTGDMEDDADAQPRRIL